MYLRYLPANQAWCFVYGDSIVPMRDKRLFDSRRDAIRRAAVAGLVVAADGEVRVDVEAAKLVM